MHGGPDPQPSHSLVRSRRSSALGCRAGLPDNAQNQAGASSGVGPLACFTRKPPPTRLPQCIPAARTSLAARGARHHPAGMFVVSEAEAAAIRTAFDRGGELSAAVELRRLFPGVTDNAQARECARISPDSRNQSTRGAIWPVALVPAAIWPGAGRGQGFPPGDACRQVFVWMAGKGRAHRQFWPIAKPGFGRLAWPTTGMERRLPRLR